tara:strand:- start:316 stop:450 length:135 start_codon:yes stop_codon:yes gene_type:complete
MQMDALAIFAEGNLTTLFNTFKINKILVLPLNGFIVFMDKVSLC